MNGWEKVEIEHVKTNHRDSPGPLWVTLRMRNISVAELKAMLGPKLFETAALGEQEEDGWLQFGLFIDRNTALGSQLFPLWLKILSLPPGEKLQEPFTFQKLGCSHVHRIAPPSGEGQPPAAEQAAPGVKGLLGIQVAVCEGCAPKVGEQPCVLAALDSMTVKTWCPNCLREFVSTADRALRAAFPGHAELGEVQAH